MVQFWYELVKNNKKTIDQVPIKWREAVEQRLEQDKEGE